MSQRMLGAFLLIVIPLLTTACSKQNKAKSMADASMALPAYQVLANKKFDGPADYLFNSERSLVLCCKNPKGGAGSLTNSTRFFVFDLTTSEVIFEDSMRGSVKWIGEHLIEVAEIPGMVKHGDEAGSQHFGYVYDLKNKRKLPRTGSNRK